MKLKDIHFNRYPVYIQWGFKSGGWGDAIIIGKEIDKLLITEYFLDTDLNNAYNHSFLVREHSKDNTKILHYEYLTPAPEMTLDEAYIAIGSKFPFKCNWNGSSVTVTGFSKRRRSSPAFDVDFNSYHGFLFAHRKVTLDDDAIITKELIKCICDFHLTLLRVGCKCSAKLNQE